MSEETKRGRGRPRTINQDTLERFTIMVDPELRDRAERYARHNRESLATAMRRALQNYVEEGVCQGVLTGK